MGYTVRHLIETDVDTLWQLLFDENVTRSMLQRAGNYGDVHLVEVREEGTLLHRHLEWRSKVELPSLAKKLVGDGSYTEIGCFDRTTQRYTGQYLPTFGRDRFRTEFAITVEPVDGGERCARTIETDNIIHVFGLGGVIARAVEHGQRVMHDHSAEFLNAWVQELRHSG